jgi:hypothetical protein
MKTRFVIMHLSSAEQLTENEFFEEFKNAGFTTDKEYASAEYICNDHWILKENDIVWFTSLANVNQSFKVFNISYFPMEDMVEYYLIEDK